MDIRARGRRVVPILVVAGLLVSAAGCSRLTRTDIDKPIRTERPTAKLHPFVYYDQGSTLFLAVDVRAAQYIEEGEIFPLGVGLANFDRSPLIFAKESFVVESADGDRYPVIGIEEYLRHYTRSPADQRLGDVFEEVMQSRFQSYNETSWRPFPVSGEAAATNSSVELGRNYWTKGYLYFPVPPTGIHGNDFTLVVRPNGADESFFLKFSIP